MIDKAVLKKKIDSLQNREKELEISLRSLEEVKDKEKEPLLLAISKIDAKYEKEEENIDKQMESLRTSIYLRQYSLKNVDSLNAFADAQRKGSGLTKDVFLGWAAAHKLHISGDKKNDFSRYYIGMKTLENGVVVVRTGHDFKGASVTFFFMGLSLIGMWYGEKSKHPGDYYYNRYLWTGSHEEYTDDTMTFVYSKDCEDRENNRVHLKDALKYMGMLPDFTKWSGMTMAINDSLRSHVVE